MLRSHAHCKRARAKAVRPRGATRCTPDPYHAGSAISLEGVIASAVVGPNPVPFGSAAEPFVRVAYDGVSGITIETIDSMGFAEVPPCYSAKQ